MNKPNSPSTRRKVGGYGFKALVSVWWHCMWNFLRDLDKGGHRMCYYKSAGSYKKEHFCSCSPRLKEVMDLFN